jgi:hypothetical protein
MRPPSPKLEQLERATPRPRREVVRLERGTAAYRRRRTRPRHISRLPTTNSTPEATVRTASVASSTSSTSQRACCASLANQCSGPLAGTVSACVAAAVAPSTRRRLPRKLEARSSTRPRARSWRPTRGDGRTGSVQRIQESRHRPSNRHEWIGPPKTRMKSIAYAANRSALGLDNRTSAAKSPTRSRGSR